MGWVGGEIVLFSVVLIGNMCSRAPVGIWGSSVNRVWRLTRLLPCLSVTHQHLFQTLPWNSLGVAVGQLRE